MWLLRVWRIYRSRKAFVRAHNKLEKMYLAGPFVSIDDIYLAERHVTATYDAWLKARGAQEQLP